MSEIRKIFTLTQLNTSLENLFWENFSNKNYWITAEVIKINQKNGHFYLELADSINDNVTARNQAVIWSYVHQNLLQTVGISDLNGILQPGNRILINVKLEYHKIYGLKLKIQDIDATYSYGEIERKRQEVIKQLKKEGIFDLQKKKRLPIIIKRIALIGSPGTSGFRDFEDELLNNHEFNKFAIRVFPVRVQGEMAVSEIISAIQEANQYDVEVIIILRGGGSKMDLALFDNYEINKQICLSSLPIITGIGHETDEVVADLVACQDFITPTAVARHIHYAISSFRQIMQELYDKSLHKSQQIFIENKSEFLHYNNYLSHYSRELIHYWKNIFQEIEFKISQNSKVFLFEEKEKAIEINHQISNGLIRIIQGEKGGVDFILEKIIHAVNRKIEYEKAFELEQTKASIHLLGQQLIDRERILISNQEELLKLLNPLKILASGYTISMIDNKDVKDMEIKIGDKMKTLSSNSLIISEVIQIEKNEYENK